MRICIPVPCFFRKIDFCQAIERIAALGFDAAETYDWSRLDPNAVREACQRCGVELLSMCTSEFRMTDAAWRGAWLDGLEKSCDMANRMGVKKLITQVGPDTGASRQTQHENIVETLRQATPILEEHGVTVMVEPLNTLYDHPGYYLWSAVEGFDIIRAVNHPLVKLVYDIYHQQVMEGNIINNVTNNLDCIAHLHAAGHPGRIELQQGENDYKCIWKRIDEAGYTGACGLEYNPVMQPEASLREFRRLYLGDQ